MKTASGPGPRASGRRWLFAVVAAAAALMPRAAEAGDPLRVYKELETDHFLICYWEPLDDVAQRVGVVAEHVHRTLSPAIDNAPPVKTIIVISDDTDDANGFAGVLPRNAIQLYATGPTSFSELDDHEDWLYALVQHEYTHILHLDVIEGAPAIYNKIFGKTWAPSQIMPRWLIEGIAVYEESKRTTGGRDRGTIFDQYIRIARHAGVDLRLDEVSGAPRQFPRGNAAYVYGSHFMKYIFDRFGDDTLRALAHLGGGYPVPFAVNRQIAKAVGEPFTELYEDWKLYLRDRYAMEETAAERRGLRVGRKLTETAETNQFLRWSADGKWLYWQQYDGYSLIWVRRMPAGGTQKDAENVAQIEAMGPFDLEPDGSFVFEQGLTYRREYSFEDLVRWDATTGAFTRLTHGARARDPGLSPDGRRVAYSRNEHSDSVLAVMDTVPDGEPSIVWRGTRYGQAYQPAWSPDATRIAFSAWRDDGYRDIVVVELASGKTVDITHDRAIDQQPSWSADGRYIFFTSDRTGIANIYAYDTTARTTYQVTNVWGGAYDARRVARRQAARLRGRGGARRLRPLRGPARPVAVAARARLRRRQAAAQGHQGRRGRGRRAAAVPRDRDARAPQTWTAAVDTTNTASVQTAGTDAFGLHSYSLAIGTDLTNGNTDVGASYNYTGLRPNLGIAASRSLVERNARVDGVLRPFPEEDWSGTASVSVPFESRPGSSWALSFDYDFDGFRQVGEPAGLVMDPNQREPKLPLTNFIQSGGDVRLSFSNVRSVTFSLGAYTGFDASVAVRVDHPDFGSSYRDITLSYATDWYQNLHNSTTALALRVSGAFRAGDLDGPGGFSLGGIPAQDVVQSIVNSTRAGITGYLRGYPSFSVSGNQYHLANFELRHELFLIEHGLGTLPIYLRRVHLAALADAGTAYNTRARREGLARVDRRRGAARRVLRLLRPRHVRARLLEGPHQRRRRRELVPAHREPVGGAPAQRGRRRRGRGRGRCCAPARRAGARPARPPRPRRRSPRAPRRDVDRADAVSVARAAGAAPGPRRRVPRGDAPRAPARRARPRAADRGAGADRRRRRGRPRAAPRRSSPRRPRAGVRPRQRAARAGRRRDRRPRRRADARGVGAVGRARSRAARCRCA